jgi:hypothetical protein
VTWSEHGLYGHNFSCQTFYRSLDLPLCKEVPGGVLLGTWTIRLYLEQYIVMVSSQSDLGDLSNSLMRQGQGQAGDDK